MYSFEGEFRKVPEQNLAGASRKEGRNELILRAHLERSKREVRMVFQGHFIIFLNIQFHDLCDAQFSVTFNLCF